MDEVTVCIQRLKQAMKDTEIQPENGLGNELFLFSTTLVPLLCIDLLVMNKQGNVLLSWRMDEHCGTGWYVPGGCIRLGETFAERIEKTALAELGAEVTYDPRPIRVYEYFAPAHRENLSDQRERSHVVTLTFSCQVSDNYKIPAKHTHFGRPGCLQWFSDMPKERLALQDCYWSEWDKLLEEVGSKRHGEMEQ